MWQGPTEVPMRFEIEYVNSGARFEQSIQMGKYL